jgi:hypothetical protein
MYKPTIKEIVEAYNRRRKGKTGFHLKVIKQVCLDLYLSAQDKKLN